MMAGFGGVMLKMMSPLLICEAPERGEPLPATEPGVLDPQDPAALDAASLPSGHATPRSTPKH